MYVIRRAEQLLWASEGNVRGGSIMGMGGRGLWLGFLSAIPPHHVELATVASPFPSRPAVMPNLVSIESLFDPYTYF